MNRERVEGLIKELLLEIGEDPEREGLARTPQRVAAALDYLTSGYRTDIDELIGKAVFTQEIDHMVIARDIELYSMCEHHMLSIIGRCHIGYVPQNGRVVGISKLARIVDVYARRLQLQERMTEEIAHAIMDHLKPQGVGVIIEARHLCMMMRGVEKQNSMMITSSVLGAFRKAHATRDEFLSLINRASRI